MIFTLALYNGAGDKNQSLLRQVRFRPKDAEGLALKSKEVKKMTHNDTICTKYNEPVLPDNDGNCSLCGATLTGKGGNDNIIDTVAIIGISIAIAWFAIYGVLLFA